MLFVVITTAIKRTLNEREPLYRPASQSTEFPLVWARVPGWARPWCRTEPVVTRVSNSGPTAAQGEGLGTESRFLLLQCKQEQPHFEVIRDGGRHMHSEKLF